MRPPGRTQASRGQESDLGDVTRQQQLADLVDDYVSWREACASVQAAYDRWRHAALAEQQLAYSEYIDALDREENMATRCRRAVERVAAMDGPDRAT